MDNLKSINNLSGNMLSIGQKLKISESASPSSGTYYTVKKGDSLYQIAKQYNTTVSNLMTIKNLKSSDLSIGQKLKVPVSSTTTSQNIYTVKSGDTLYSIARANNTTVSDLIAKNNLSTSTLSVGQKLLI